MRVEHNLGSETVSIHLEGKKEVESFLVALGGTSTEGIEGAMKAYHEDGLMDIVESEMTSSLVRSQAISLMEDVNQVLQVRLGCDTPEDVKEKLKGTDTNEADERAREILEFLRDYTTRMMLGGKVTPQEYLESISRMADLVRVDRTDLISILTNAPKESVAQATQEYLVGERDPDIIEDFRSFLESVARITEMPLRFLD